MTLVATATAAFVAALQQSPAVAPQVARVRLRALSASATTAVVVRPVSAEVAERTLRGPLRWALQIAVECYAKSSATTTAPDASVDALVASAYSRLMADTTLGSAVTHIDPVGLTYDFDADGDQTACATLVFNVTTFSEPTTL